MTKSTTPLVTPVNLIMGILTAREPCIEEASQLLEDRLGPIDYRSPAFPFSVTDYYNEEFGSPIQRFFLSFAPMITPDELAVIKQYTAEVEDRFRQEDKRRINLDPGYMDFHKIVLASFKYGAYKIYLSQGVYGDMTSLYAKGRFSHFAWSFPDFKLDLYSDVFLKIRQLYKRKLSRLKEDKTLDHDIE